MPSKLVVAVALLASPVASLAPTPKPELSRRGAIEGVAAALSTGAIATLFPAAAEVNRSEKKY